MLYCFTLLSFLVCISRGLFSTSIPCFSSTSIPWFIFYLYSPGLFSTYIHRVSFLPLFPGSLFYLYSPGLFSTSIPPVLFYLYSLVSVLPLLFHGLLSTSISRSLFYLYSLLSFPHCICPVLVSQIQLFALPFFIYFTYFSNYPFCSVLYTLSSRSF